MGMTETFPEVIDVTGAADAEGMVLGNAGISGNNEHNKSRSPMPRRRMLDLLCFIVAILLLL